MKNKRSCLKKLIIVLCIIILALICYLIFFCVLSCQIIKNVNLTKSYDEFKLSPYSQFMSWSSVTYLISWLINRGYVRYNIYSVDDFNKVKPHIKKGNVVILSSRYDGNFNHAVLVGDITKYNIYYYAHTEDRSALDHSYGLMDYFFIRRKEKTENLFIRDIGKEVL